MLKQLSPIGAMAAVLFLAGCGSGGSSPSPTNPVSGTPVVAGPLASLSASALAFPATPVGTATTLTVTLSNTGSAALSVTSVTVTGTNPSVFASANTCASVAAAGSCVLTVSFTPAAASAAYTATLVVTDNSGGVAGSNQTLSLSGSGAAPVPTPQAVLTPASLSFSSPLNTSSAAQTVTLSNPGTATLTGIVITTTGSATFAQTSTTCGTTLAAAATCTISLSFTPTAAGTATGTLSVADNATGSPQTVALTGTGALPLATLSSASIAFSPQYIGSTSAASTVTLTNNGAATLTLSSIAASGSGFAQTNTCGLTLAIGASCSISATFTPAAASAYTGAITITDSAANSPQTIALSGTGTASSVTHTLYSFPETDNSVTPLYALINGAQKTIDMTMYALEDTTFSGDLVTACQRGVKVRVILDQNDEKSGNTPAYTLLNSSGANCSAVWANKAFEATHEKSFILDGTQVAIMSLNLQSQYYSTTRDFALLTNDTADIAAIQATFNADYAAGTPSSGIAGTSDFSYTPGPGDDLIWSPTTAQAAMLAIINNAKATLLVENEEMGAANIVSALEAACQRGVVVRIAMVSQSSYATNFKALEAAGCGVHVYADTTNGFYIHAKAVVADFGLTTQSVYMGSINYSLASMNNNRELGVYISDSPSVTSLNTIMAADYAGGAPY
jgi:hypothetical protein